MDMTESPDITEEDAETVNLVGGRIMSITKARVSPEDAVKILKEIDFLRYFKINKKRLKRVEEIKKDLDYHDSQGCGTGLKEYHFYWEGRIEELENLGEK